MPTTERKPKEPHQMMRSEFEQTHAKGIIAYINRLKSADRGEVRELTRQMVEAGVMDKADLKTPDTLRSECAEVTLPEGLSEIAVFHNLKTSAHFAHIRFVQKALSEGKEVPTEILEFYRDWTDGNDIGWADIALFDRKYRDRGLFLRRKVLNCDEKSYRQCFVIEDRQVNEVFQSDIVGWKDAPRGIEQAESWAANARMKHA